MIALPLDFAHFVALSFGQLRHYAASDMIAALHFLRVIGEVAADCRRSDQIEILRVEAVRFADLAARKLEGADALAAERRAADLMALLARGAYEPADAPADWLSANA